MLSDYYEGGQDNSPIWALGRSRMFGGVICLQI